MTELFDVADLPFGGLSRHLLVPVYRTGAICPRMWGDVSQRTLLHLPDGEGWTMRANGRLFDPQDHRQSTRPCRDGRCDVRPPVSVGVWWRASFASAIASSENSVSATTRLIKPRLAASFEVTNTRPVKINSIAAFRPTLRGKRCVPPKVGMIPILISAFAKVALAAASAMCWISVSSHPPPNAIPFDRRDNRLWEGFPRGGHLMARAHEVYDGICWSSLHMFLKPRDVAPALNARPLPLSQRPRTVESRSMLFNTFIVVGD
jgi:hypothetical protein